VARKLLDIKCQVFFTPPSILISVYRQSNSSSLNVGYKCFIYSDMIITVNIAAGVL